MENMCREFVGEHNHDLHIDSTVHMMRSQRHMSDIHMYEIELADDLGIRPRFTVELMGRQAGGIENLICTTQDVRNYLRTKRMNALSYGEVGSLLKYFATQTRNNPSFTYSVQLDSEEQITNIFWVDPKMIIDYAQFGDVVSFNTTFRTNRQCRPLGVFARFNHHRGYTVFGATLLYDETVKSFKWLFENDINHLGNMMKDGSGFLKDIKKCIYQYDEEEQFDRAWYKLLSENGVMDNAWLRRIDLKDYLKSTLDVVQFVKHFERVLNQERGNELKTEFEARNKLPRLANSIGQTDRFPFIDFWVGIVDVEGEYQCIPDAYILKRWTWGARTMVVNDSGGEEVEEDVNLDCTQRLKVSNIRINPTDCSDMPILLDFPTDVYDGMRLKYKEKSKGGRRLKSWVEKQDCPNGQCHMQESISHISSQASAVHQSQASAVHQSLDEDCI
ncbi:protein FAR1-RELATED SEQUENCE 5-like [Macadamia integrifolia]|uniref:protein FAR1-RELATED SEQUENCE 5-like n=1 Tax=Macadamia integrifolia TaxID=60698 RepID=UPI001C4F0717|nr:protein FAR1-RELATED SEQUENCE 5-like [Macadamia integrifolia]